jgi:hypothetical protein
MDTKDFKAYGNAGFELLELVKILKTMSFKGRKE